MVKRQATLNIRQIQCPKTRIINISRKDMAFAIIIANRNQNLRPKLNRPA